MSELNALCPPPSPMKERRGKTLGLAFLINFFWKTYLNK